MKYNLSYSSSPATKPVLYNTYVDMMKHWAELYPDKDAFVEYNQDCERRSLSCSELLTRATQFGKYLMASGLKKGEVVVLCMKNSLEMITAMFGVYRCGAIVGCATASLQDGSDVVDYVKATDAKIVVLDDIRSESRENITHELVDAVKCLGVLKVVINRRRAVKSSSNDVVQDNMVTCISFDEALKQSLHDDIDFPDVFPEDPAVYFQTSGSSGKPKIARHSHFSWIDSTFALNEQVGISATSAYFCDRPFGWGVGSPRTFAASGATRVFLDTSLTVGNDMCDMLSDIMATEAVSHAYLPGYLVADLLARPDSKTKFTTLDTVICSGERIPKTHGRLLGQFCRRLAIWYGSTEMNGVSAYTTTDPEALADGIIGLPTSGVEIKLVDPATKNAVPRGEHGELYARNIHRLTAYVGQPDKFREAVDSGNWFRSGDVGYVREDGNYVLDGRVSEQITMATLKIFPFDIEKELLKCPGVFAAMAVPIPDIRLTNVVCACVVFDRTTSGNGLELVREYCERIWVESDVATGISLRPKYFLEFEQILTNTNGKFDRRTMAAEARNRLEL